LVVDGASAAESNDESPVDIDREIDLAFAAGGSVADVARELARRGLASRAELYARASARRDARRRRE
ncbi:MAG: hypothetical protein IAI50_21310, partial [Candidatus Eremiobacteraeota bacterium]|nr:hypothetical protein [Candidatus Eremiobacteraeota bacterium]